MAIAPLQPHKSWYRHFWYAEKSPRDTLADRTLLFAIIALSLVVAGTFLVRQYAVQPTASVSVVGSAER